MGECLLVRRGGGKPTLKGISVKTPPAKLEYMAGDTFDPTGLVLTADVGGVPINVTTGYTITPETLTADTTHVTISYTADGRTVSTTQAVTVIECDPVLENNTWEKIAEIAATGKAAEVWSLGDVKQLSINGTNYPATIVDFNHHDLDSTDAMYGDAAYNGGSNKAGITFWVAGMYGNTSYGIHGSETDSLPNWRSTVMRTTVMPEIMDGFPDGLQGVLRTVRTPANSYDNTADQVFLFSSIEIGSKKGYTTYIKDHSGSQLAYFTAGNDTRLKRNNSYYPWWTRTKSASNAYVAVDTDGDLYYKMGQACGAAPGFCL